MESSAVSHWHCVVAVDGRTPDFLNEHLVRPTPLWRQLRQRHVYNPGLDFEGSAFISAFGVEASNFFFHASVVHDVRFWSGESTQCKKLLRDLT